MPSRVLVLHGPTLTLEAVLGQSLASLDASLLEKGRALGLEVECVQANGEAALLDALLAREGVAGVIVNPASLAPIALALADALEALRVPCVEVQLSHEAKGRGRSALRRVVEKQFHGHGVAGYEKALAALAKQLAGAADQTASSAAGAGEDHADDEREAHDDEAADAGVAPRAMPSGKTIGRKRTAAPAASAATPGKTIGRRPAGASSSTSPNTASVTGVISRAMVREQLSARLGKKLSADAFAQWARAQWLALQKGAPVEPGQREALEELLLMLSTSAKASDHVILSYAARLST